ncbi:lysylphosphatidylglycerol synthase transmembrane domain-containing protein [Streptomyces sp. IMTB 2501]|uniref:lysylphosphatidylglycerol synthase transmembrane domain-containing protein n=1 Tax=Streptomyces sp. IMTB 2501 TaxID=1776340 RepID=UPI002117183E|nr:lysylphosphatidylglycerol synthase transmembrane domain-containing protein [Streptomyces sp. IMTB 2501]
MAVLVAAALVLVSVLRRRELAQAYHLIAGVRPLPVAVAVVCEVLSLVCFAAVYRWLLEAGRTRWSLRRATALVVAANAVAGALPGGAAFSAAWVFRQLRRRGVEQVLAVAVLVVAGALSVLALAVLLVAGTVGAGPAGLRTVLLPVAGALLVLGIALAVVGVSRFAGVRNAVGRAWTSAGMRSRHIRRGQEALAQLVEQARSLQPGLRPWLRPFAFALLNWAFDVACLAASLWALGIGVPWHSLLLAYVLTQIPGSLRLTPGSLGIVETSLSALLVLYGLGPGPAIAATLLYRAIGYWALQPIGWASWLALTLQTGASGPRHTTRNDAAT